MTDKTWDVHLSADAAADIEGIVEWTARKFGEQQANKMLRYDSASGHVAIGRTACAWKSAISRA